MPSSETQALLLGGAATTWAEYCPPPQGPKKMDTRPAALPQSGFAGAYDRLGAIRDL